MRIANVTYKINSASSQFLPILLSSTPIIVSPYYFQELVLPKYFLLHCYIIKKNEIFNAKKLKWWRMKIFEAIQACKKIDGTMILQDVTISISQGERVAITGKNGSGKSSLLKLIGGIYEETTGQVKRAPVSVGYVPEHFPEYIRFSLQDYLMQLGKMSCIAKEEIQQRIENYAKRFAIIDFLNIPLKHCSKGTKQKAGIIQALLKNPVLLLMDEPLTGLDDNAKIELMNLLSSLHKEKTIVFTAHDPLLIEGIADRVLTVENGKIVGDSIKRKQEKRKLIKAKIPAKEIIERLPCNSYTVEGENFVEIIVPNQKSDEILAKLLELGCSIIELTEKR